MSAKSVALLVGLGVAARFVWLSPAVLAQGYQGGQPYTNQWSGQGPGAYVPAGQPTAPPGAPGGYPGQPMAQPPAQPAAQQPPAVPYQMAERLQPQPVLQPPKLEAAQPNEHPLVPSIRWAKQGLAYIEQTVRDYSAVMTKRERIGNKVGEAEHVFLKVRHKPLSVYMYFLKPDSLQGQEVIWAENQNNGKLMAHLSGMKRMLGTWSLDPNGSLAMRGQHYPISEIGFLNMIRRLAEQGEKDSQYGECDVTYLQAKVQKRDCVCIQVVHPRPRSNFIFHVAQVFIDQELNLPVRYAAYDWPTTAGGSPELLEEYTYTNIKINNGFTDADFDVRNPNYQFQRSAPAQER